MSISRDKLRNRILVVDDSDLERTLLCRALSRHGFDVLEVGNGREALDTIQEQPTLSTVITDIQMPGLSGIDLLKLFRYTHWGLPCLVVSGGDAPPDLHGFEQVRFIHKPIQYDDMVESVWSAWDNDLYDDEVLEFLGELVRTFMNSHTKLVDLVAVPPFLKYSTTLLGHLSASISFHGPKLHGQISVSTAVPWWNKLAKSLLGTEAEFEGQLFDVAAEVCNTFAGKLREHYSQRGLSSQMSTPTVTLGERVRVLSNSQRPHLVVPCRARGLPQAFFVELQLADKGEDGVATEEILPESELNLL